MSSAILRVARVSPDLTWRAVDGDDEIGVVTAIVRPDRRCFVRFRECRGDACAPLLAAVDEELGSELYVTVDEGDEEALRRYEQLGFVVNRREHQYLVPTDPKVTGLRAFEVREGVVFVPADRVDADRLRTLDDALRQDVPGTDGWEWDAAAFRDETFDPSYFDPATYLVAVVRTTGEYVGLVRIWKNPDGPRLGLIAVLPPHRRGGLAKALLAHAFAVLHERGEAYASAEVDATNVASTSLLTRRGARRTGGSIELVRRPPTSRDRSSAVENAAR